MRNSSGFIINILVQILGYSKANAMQPCTRDLKRNVLSAVCLEGAGGGRNGGVSGWGRQQA